MIRFLVLAAAAVLSSAAHAEKVEILRDDFGVPHVFAHTPAGAAYGSGYAQASDRLDQLLKNLRAVPPEATEFSPPVKAIVAAYCAGINAYLEENHSKEARVEPAMVAAFSRRAFGLATASADIVMAPWRSSARAVTAILQPISEWSGESRFYEIRMYAADTGFAFSGAAPVGLPFPLIGHSQDIVIGVSGSGDAGPNALDQAWALIGSRNLAQIKQALALRQMPRQRFLIGTADGDIYDSRGVTNPPGGYLLGATDPSLVDPIKKAFAASTSGFSLDTAQALAFSTEVYKAEAWQMKIAKVAPASDFARALTGWSRRAEPKSQAALFFYLFKTALGAEGRAPEPPDSLSDDRVRAALRKAQDRYETEFPYQATLGSLLRLGREGARQAWPVGAGGLPQAGLFTARPLVFEQRGTSLMAYAGQAAVQVVALSRPARSLSALPFGESDDPESTHFDDQARELYGKGIAQPSYFADRKELEKHAKSRQELIFSAP